MLAVALVLLAMGAPPIKSMAYNNQMAAETNKLISNLLLARSEAVKRQTNIVICPSADGNSCSGDWASKKRIVFVDVDKDGAYESDDGEEMLISQAATKHQQAWTVNQGTEVVFFSTGMVKADSSNLLKLTSDERHRCIQIFASGRSATTDCS